MTTRSMDLQCCTEFYGVSGEWFTTHDTHSTFCVSATQNTEHATCVRWRFFVHMIFCRPCYTIGAVVSNVRNRQKCLE